MLVADYQSASGVELELCSASAKYFLMYSDGHQANHEKVYLAFTVLGRRSGSQILPQPASGPSVITFKFDFQPFTCTSSYSRFDLTTDIVEYCTPKAEYTENLKHKNIPKHVSNNCLVLTYN